MHSRSITPEGEEALEALAEALSISDSRYEQADTSYASLGEWLDRPESTVRIYDPKIYVQGSFRLGTAIRPRTEDDEYDVDSVCEFQLLTKHHITQAELKEKLRVEIEAYRRVKGIKKPLHEGQRCWVLEYAVDAQFHMDIVPALPNGETVRRMLRDHGYQADRTETAIAITDNETDNYHLVSDDWPRSNPKGYADWFVSRMRVVFDRRRRALADQGKFRAEVESIPIYKVRTPLQSAIMILKRHRDEMFAERSGKTKPISIILTTLSAHAYGQEETIGGALTSILSRMNDEIRIRNGKYWIANPTDPMENFADKWEKYPERAKAFFEWLEKAREDFLRVAAMRDRKAIRNTLRDSVGPALTDRALPGSFGAAVLTSGLIRDEAAARENAVRMEGDNRSG